MKNINVTLEDGNTISCPAYTRVGDLADRSNAQSDLPLLGVMVNNEVSSLSYPLTADSTIRFLTVADTHGWRIYRRSIAFVLAKAIAELFPSAQFNLEHSFGTGLYCSFAPTGDHGPNNGLSAKQLGEIQERMRDIVSRDVPIERRKLSYTQAVAHFETSQQFDKLNLLKFRNPPRIVIHTCEGFSDLAHSPLAQSSGTLAVFDLIHYPPGFVLQLPDRTAPARVADFVDQPHLFEIYREHKEWGHILKVDNVGRLNEIIADGGVTEFIRSSEALHEKKAAAIADTILADREKVKVILVAGPSCAGKTTFSKRLSIHLRANGIRPKTIEMDDYFVNESNTPKDENGDYDFEHVEAVDIELFNRDLLSLMDGGSVELPTYDFEKRERISSGNTLQIGADEILIVEGIHGLNPRLTHMVPVGRKFRVYVSALTQLALDSNNRISTTDNRLMRRMIRDSKYRGNSPLVTLGMWPSVRRGEKKWIFPFQREADATFNSALDYELAVLKPLIEPLLHQIKPSSPEYAEARRLEAFLSNFLAVSDAEVPRTSILREYIGRSAFDY